MALLPLRSVRSFVLRQGHLSKAQENARQQGMAKWGISYTQHLLALEEVFGRVAPKILEIGSGMGQATAMIAQTYPDNDYLAVEVHTPGIGSLCKLIADYQLNNLRIIQHDAVEVVEHMLPFACLDGVHIFFPDPWPKKRHHKRRLIQSTFIELIVSRIKIGGYIHLATDWQDYAEQMLQVLTDQSNLTNSYSTFAPRLVDRPLTKFEQRGLALNHQVWDLKFIRNN